jgi:hypothetical protein
VALEDADDGSQGSMVCRRLMWNIRPSPHLIPDRVIGLKLEQQPGRLLRERR